METTKTSVVAIGAILIMIVFTIGVMLPQGMQFTGKIAPVAPQPARVVKSKHDEKTEPQKGEGFFIRTSNGELIPYTG